MVLLSLFHLCEVAANGACISSLKTVVVLQYCCLLRSTYAVYVINRTNVRIELRGHERVS